MIRIGLSNSKNPPMNSSRARPTGIRVFYEIAPLDREISAPLFARDAFFLFCGKNAVIHRGAFCRSLHAVFLAFLCFSMWHISRSKLGFVGEFEMATHKKIIPTNP